MPYSKKDISIMVPELYNLFLSRFIPKENDVIIIASALNRKHAEQGAIMSALELFEKRN